MSDNRYAVVDGHVGPRLRYLESVEGAALPDERRDDLRRRAAAANELVRLRARHHTQTETVAYTPIEGHNAAVNVVAFHGNPPLGREVLVFREVTGWCRWVDPQRVVIERIA
jgi:hypothetical protein